MSSSTDNHGPSSAISSFGRSIYRLRQEQVHSLEENHRSSTRDSELESFQKQVTDRFEDLRSISEFFERLVKALDICNASRDGIEKIRVWLKHLEIVLCALGSNQRALSEGQVQRARKALMDSALAMLDEKDCSCRSVFPQRNTLTYSIKFMECVTILVCSQATWFPLSGLAIPVYTMNSVLLLQLFLVRIEVSTSSCQFHANSRGAPRLLHFMNGSSEGGVPEYYDMPS